MKEQVILGRQKGMSMGNMALTGASFRQTHWRRAYKSLTYVSGMSTSRSKRLQQRVSLGVEDLTVLLNSCREGKIGTETTPPDEVEALALEDMQGPSSDSRATPVDASAYELPRGIQIKKDEHGLSDRDFFQLVRETESTVCLRQWRLDSQLCRRKIRCNLMR